MEVVFLKMEDGIQTGGGNLSRKVCLAPPLKVETKNEMRDDELGRKVKTLKVMTALIGGKSLY